jgi:nucleotide-binding universal stress UspA family protein
MPWTFDDASKQRTVLLPFDFSPPAIDAIATARSFVGDPQRLVIVHVVPPIATVSPGYLHGDVDPSLLRSRAEAALTRAVEQAGVGEAQQQVRMGDPSTELLAAAKAFDADLIVIPSHGKTGMLRWMLGSVAERIVRRAPCPVLVLPAHDPDSDSDSDSSEGRS